MRNQGMDTDTKPAAFSGCRHAGGFHRMVELVNTYGYPLDEMASGLGQPNAARMTLEQEDAEVGVVCGRGRNPTLRLWPAIFSGEIDVFPSERRNMGQEIGR